MNRFLADEDFDHRVVRCLKAIGHDVITVMDINQRGQSDAAQLAFATAQRRILLTFNRADFHALHRQGIIHSGIITCTRDSDFSALASRIDAAVAGRNSLARELIRIVRG